MRHEFIEWFNGLEDWQRVVFVLIAIIVTSALIMAVYYGLLNLFGVGGGYFMVSEYLGAVKVGESNNPAKRNEQIRDNNVFDAELAWFRRFWTKKGAQRWERKMHQRNMADKLPSMNIGGRLNTGREWFAKELSELKSQLSIFDRLAGNS